MKFPSANKWVTSPLRNSVKIELNATAKEVWKVVANPTNIFSSCYGVNNVESKTDDSNRYTDYTIYYKSEHGGEDMIARSTMVWHELNQGWASLDNDPHPMGFEQSLLLVKLKEKEGKTVLKWHMYYDIENDEILQMLIKELDQSLKEEIAQFFIQKFGGRII